MNKKIVSELNFKNYKELLEKTDFKKIPGLKNAHIKLLEKIKENIVNNNAIYKKGWLISNNSNLTTNKNYDLFNTMLLNIAKDEKEYNSSQWLTFIQMKNLNEKYKLKDYKEIKLKKGSVGEKIIYKSIYNKLEKRNMTYEEFNQLSLNEQLEKLNNGEIYFFHKEATVFNLDCFENIPIDLIKEEIIENREIDVDLAKLIANEMGVTVNFTNQDKACYYPLNDSIDLPKKELWINNEMFKRTLFHELSHATAHETRLNREIKTKEKNKYAKEELIAETSSLFLSTHFNYETETNLSTSSKYLESYSNVLITNPKLILYSISEATKVSNYLLNIYEKAKEKQLENLKEDNIMENKEIFLKKDEIEILNFVKDNVADYMEGLEISEILDDMFDEYFTYPYEVYDFIKENDLNAFEMINYIKKYSQEQGYNALENLDLSNELKVGHLYLVMKSEELVNKYLNFDDININSLNEEELKNIENQIKNLKIYTIPYVEVEKYNLDFNETKELVKGLLENNHKNFIKALISCEKGIDNEGILIETYNEYMNKDNIDLLSEEISDFAKNLEQKENKRNRNDMTL